MNPNDTDQGTQHQEINPRDPGTQKPGDRREQAPDQPDRSSGDDREPRRDMPEGEPQIPNQKPRPEPPQPSA